jgi:hypothetical protein
MTDSTEKKKKELTTMEQAFLEYLFHEDVKGNFRRAMKLAGYSDNMAPSIIKKQLKDEIIERAKLELAAHSAQAVLAISGIFDDPNAMGTKNKIEAAKQVLDRIGIVKPEGNSDINLKVPDGGLIILPAKRGVEE